ncbi:helix-turn-helix domain-containing protein [Streptomyces roseoverticillatus]|uniref:helix-turn-helix domain-containing protein n=1 Tax=Streptomyces roseoverticillatus TaxID=66429 RepID=UPI003403615B
MVTVEQWTGREAVLLQSVMRMSVRGFAEHLGVSPRTVTKWRKQGASLVCVPEMQQILDTALATCPPEARAAFYARLAALNGTGSVPHQHPGMPAGAPGQPFHVISHKFLPAYVGGPLAVAWQQGRPVPPGPAGLERRALTITHPTARAATLYAYACGVALLHLEQHQEPASITDLAVWRYRTYLDDRAWAGQLLTRLLGTALPDGRPAPAPGYVLSVYELGTHSWNASTLPTAMQLLVTPSVLVDRRDPANIRGLASDVEAHLFATSWEHPDAVEFSGAVSMGLAGWSGIAYHPLASEQALTALEIVDLELDVQTLWALSAHIQALLESGQDPVMPEGYGRPYLAATYSRLTQSGPIETVQHRLMRKAILATSELPERLKAAQDVLVP